VVLVLWVLLLRTRGKIENVLLTKGERIFLSVLTVVFFAIYMFTGANPVHGHGPLDFHPATMAAVTIGVAALLWANHRALTRRGIRPVKKLPYTPRSMHLGWFFLWLVWHFGISMVLLTNWGPGPYLHHRVGLLALLGMVTGAAALGISIVRHFRRRGRREQKRIYSPKSPHTTA